MTVEIKICMGSACFARGNSQNVEIIENYIKENKLDANVELVGSHCEGKCADGPNLYVNGKHYSNVTPETLESILKGLS